MKPLHTINLSPTGSDALAAVGETVGALLRREGLYSSHLATWHHQREPGVLKGRIEQSCLKQQIEPGQLTLHIDRVSSMKSNVVAQLLAEIGVTKTHCRPDVSNDNPYS